MSDSLLSKELIEALRPIVEMNNEQFRHSTIMLAGFIATDERDIDYMDRYMDPIFDFMDPMSDTELLMRNYYAHISTFNPKEANRRFKELENDMGYYARAVLAAGLVATANVSTATKRNTTSSSAHSLTSLFPSPHVSSVHRAYIKPEPNQTWVTGDRGKENIQITD